MASLMEKLISQREGLLEIIREEYMHLFPAVDHLSPSRMEAAIKHLQHTGYQQWKVNCANEYSWHFNLQNLPSVRRLYHVLHCIELAASGASDVDVLAAKMGFAFGGSDVIS